MANEREFGEITARLDNIEELLRIMREDMQLRRSQLDTRIGGHSDRIRALEHWKARVTGAYSIIYALIAAAVALIVSWFRD